MKQPTLTVESLGAFLLELIFYAIFVVVYFLVVLNFLGDWAKHLFEENRKLYAIIALGLIVGQGAGLEFLTSLLSKMVQRKRR